MIVGIDTRPLSYQLTGIGYYLKDILDALQKIDHKNHYILISNSPIRYQLKNKYWSKVEGTCKKKLLSTFWMQINAPIIIKQRKVELFWGTRHHLPLLMPAKVKTILTIHDVVHRLYPKTMAMPNLLLERILMRRSLQRADFILADSISTANDLKRFYPVAKKKTRVVYPGVPTFPENNDCTDFKLPASRFVLFVGTLEPRKNFERVLKAFWKTNPFQHGVHLVIAGAKGWKSNKLRQQLESPPYSKYVTFTGYVTRGQLQTLYKKALCVVFPSLYEGFGFPILEAMSCGTPVITASVSSMPEVAGNSAILVDPYDVEAIGNSLQRIITDDSLRSILAEKGIKQSRRFCWDAYARELLSVFEDQAVAHADLS